MKNGEPMGVGGRGGSPPIYPDDVAVKSLPPGPVITLIFTVAGIALAAFYVEWFLTAYDQPQWTMVTLSAVCIGVLLAGIPVTKTRFATAGSVVALGVAALVLLASTAVLSTATNMHLCLLALGFVLLTLVPDHMHLVRGAGAGIVIPLIIACEFLFRPSIPLSLDEANRDGTLSSVNRVWTVVVIVLAMGIIRYRSSYKQRNLSGAAELGEHRANTDAMTGIFNRRPVLARLRELDADDSHRYAIALIDIDSFKSINDRLGHEEGDALISTIALRLRTHFRQTDLVSRWGGDEFLVLMPYVERNDIVNVLERLRASVASSPFSLGTDPIPVTLSIGAAIAGPGMSGHATINTADRALYTAKHTGRNRVVLAHAETDTTVEQHETRNQRQL